MTNFFGLCLKSLYLDLTLFKEIILFIHCLAVLGFHCHAGFSLFAVSGANSLVEVCGLLTAVACLVMEHRL